MARDKTDKTDRTPDVAPEPSEWGIPNWREAPFGHRRPNVSKVRRADLDASCS